MRLVVVRFLNVVEIYHLYHFNFLTNVPSRLKRLSRKTGLLAGWNGLTNTCTSGGSTPMLNVHSQLAGVSGPLRSSTRPTWQAALTWTWTQVRSVPVHILPSVVRWNNSSVGES